jgi:radical SAM superfamily enzyme YgiQ (UPF0313 family)
VTVLLVQPRAGAEPAYPLALASMIPPIEQQAQRVLAADLSFDRADEIVRNARASGVTWAGATLLAHTADQVRDLFARLRGLSSARTFVSGALPTLDPGASLEISGADVAIVGDAEIPASRLVSGEDPRTVPGAVTIVDVREGRVPGPVRTPLDELPLPDRVRFPLRRYTHAMRAMATPYAAVFTSRGCSRSCPYCAGPAIRPRGFDGRSPARVVEELHALARDHSIRSALVEDDAFLADPGRVREICDRLIDDPPGLVLELVNGIRPGEADGNLFARMRRAGVRRVVYSFEHIREQGTTREGCSLEDAERAVRIAREARMRVGGYFIVGLPGARFEETSASIRLALGLGLDDSNFTPLYHVRGSEYEMLHAKAERESLPRSVTAPLAAAAQAAFFARPRPLGRLATDLVRDPRTLPALVRKGLEILGRGGPVPVRDAP